jgi:hypothetical protein
MGVQCVEMRCQRGSFVCMREKDIAKLVRTIQTAFADANHITHHWVTS